jgi:acetyl esterase/lipase
MKLIFAFFCFAITSCSLRTVEPEYTYSYYKNVVYKSVDGRSLSGDFFIPNALPNEKTKLRPAVLVVHGGSWSARFGDMESICRALAKSGYIAFNVTYRLAPQSLYPAAVDDVTDALKWLHENSNKYGIDPNRISGWGYSAGAHLVLMAGLDPQNKMRSIVAGGTPANLTVWPKSPIVGRFIGKTYPEAKKTWEEASPVTRVKSGSPPTFLYHGENDTLVEPNQMTMMKEALQGKNVKVETHTIKYWGHPGAYVFSHTALDKGIAFLKSN